MREPCALFYLAEPRFGGWVTFSLHLAAGLRRRGYEPRIYRLSSRTERSPRKGFGTEGYANVSLDDARAMAASMPSAVVAVQPKAGQHAHLLLDAGAGLVIHDPTELKGPLLEAVRAPRKVAVIRERILAAVRSAATTSTVTYCPHPYARAELRTGPPALRRTRHAVSLSRLDWDKHIDIIAAANELLPEGKRIEMWGAENRLYTHHKLDAAHPGWRALFRGAHTQPAVQVAHTAHYVVDMSVIAGDGEGTQYTFLEAWDADATLIVNRAWLGSGHGAVRSDETALVAVDGRTLALLLNRDEAVAADERARMRPAIEALLQAHEAASCAEQYVAAWGWKA